MDRVATPLMTLTTDLGLFIRVSHGNVAVRETGDWDLFQAEGFRPRSRRAPQESDQTSTDFLLSLSLLYFLTLFFPSFSPCHLWTLFPEIVQDFNFFPEIGPGLLLHFLHLWALINPFWVRSDVSR